MKENRYHALLHQYEGMLGMEERLLSALALSHSTHSIQYKRQRNRVETFRRQVKELRNLAEEKVPQ